MRRRLIVVFLAVSLLVTLAFVVPLGFSVRRTAEDRAIDAARADAAAVVPALVAGGTRDQVESAVMATASGRAGRMSVVTSQGWMIGAQVEGSERLNEALESGVSDIGPAAGGVEVVAAVATGPGELSAVRVLVPDSELRGDQWRAWAVLGAVGVVLVGISVLVADRLARSIVRPTQELAEAARRLGAGDLGSRVEASGPEELVELGGAFNSLGAEVGGMLDRERELVAELSHRLRTPLTKLRMRVDEVGDPDVASALRRDIDGVTAAVDGVISEARAAIAGPQQCDVGALVAERVDFWSVLADDQGRAWTYDGGSGPVFAAVAESELSAAVDVLIENVFSHTPDGAALSVALSKGDGVATIAVGDGGAGITDERLLEAGVSGAESTGLGLDIARRTAERSGGGLSVGRSALGGAEVVLSLPVIDSPAE